MIRPTILTDTQELITLTDKTGLFLPIDLAALDEVLKEYFAEAHAQGHRCVTYEQNGKIIGYAYYAPAAMTDRTWHLWWIVVTKEIQARGIGSELLRYTEDAARAGKGRLFLAETSSLPTYEPTRRFYLKHGYEIGAVVKDYYADGHDMVIFRKRL